MGIDSKMVDVYKAIDVIEKKGRNQAQGYDYVRATDVVNAVREQFITLGIYAEIEFEFGERWSEAREKKASLQFERCRCTARLHDIESGEIRIGQGLGTGMDAGDKAIYKAQTGALKYALRNAALAPDTAADPEIPNETDKGEVERPKRPAASKPRPAPTPRREAVAATSTAMTAAALTDDEIKAYRARFLDLAGALTNDGLKPPVNQKFLRYMLMIEKADSVEHMTRQQWESFFANCSAVLNKEGAPHLVKLVEEAS